MKKTFDEIFVSLDQVGIVTPAEEVDRLKKNLMEVFQIPREGASGGNVAHHNNTIYRGSLQTPSPGVRMDFFNKDTFPVELEYLSPTEGNSAWMEFHEKWNKGLHHIRFNVAGHREAVEYMKEHGIEVYHEADSPRGKGIKFAYFDSYDKLGFYIETINLAEMEAESGAKSGRMD